MAFISTHTPSGAAHARRFDNTRLRQTYVHVEMVEPGKLGSNGYISLDAVEARQLIANLIATLADIEANPAQWEDDCS